MNILDLSTLLIVAAGTLSFIGLLCAIADREAIGWGIAISNCLAFALIVFLASSKIEGRHSIVAIGEQLTQLDRTGLVAALAGLALGLTATLANRGNRGKRFALRAAYAGIFPIALLLLSLFAFKDSLRDLVPEQSAGFGKRTVDGFEIRRIAQVSLHPTGIAVDGENRIFVSGFAGMAYQSGAVVQLEQFGQSKPVEVRVASHLNRPHGLAFHNGDLYVSRAGQFTRARMGRFVQEDTGAITRLRDTDRDGRFDLFEDIVVGLPGAQQPDPLHQNNGIAVDSQGNLYVTVGAPSDHGPVTHKFAGAILRCSLKDNSVEVFARGFRNPFGIALDSKDEVFCTDNDSVLDAGDELNHVIEGCHYGHPYTSADKALQIEGVTKPLLRFESAQGLTYAPPGSLPNGFDDCLYVAAYTENRIYRIELEEAGSTHRAQKHFFAEVPSPIDLVVSGDGRLLVASHEDQSIYEIAPREKD